MNFRTTSFSISNQAIRYSSRLNSNIFKYQKQITSGMKLHRPSDDPIAFRKATALTSRLQELRSSSGSISDAQAKLNNSVSQLTETNGLLVSAKLLAQQGVQATSPAERNAFALEAESLLTNLQNLSQSKIAGAYLYSGTETGVKPFDFSNPAVQGGTLQVDYHGSNQSSTAIVGESFSIETLAPGNEIFGRTERGETLLIGQTGAKMGRGTDNLIGRATLQVRHSATTYAGGAGVATGASSADKDTVIGPLGQHSITINDTSGNGTSGTISLNGGREIAFTNSDTDLEVVDSNGQKVYVNMSAITPGFNGTVDLTGNGTLSVDGGLTETAIDFSDSQTVTDSTSNRFAHIDTRSISTTGDDHLEFPGTSNVFQAVYELVQDLRNTRDLSGADLAKAIDRRIGELANMGDHTLDQMGQQAATLQSLSQLETRVGDLKLNTEEQLNGLIGTDIAETVLRMKNDESLLEYTYAVTAQINSVQLIDFLR